MGKRLGNITESTPKCLLEIGGKKIIGRQLEALRANDINDISIVVGFQADKVKQALKSEKVKFYLNKDFDKTGLLESIYCAKKELNDDVIIVYGDVVLNSEIIKKVLKDKNDFCLLVDKKDNIKKSSPRVRIVDGIIKEISRDIPEEYNLEYIGVSKYSRKGIKMLLSKISELIKNGEIKKYPSPSYLFNLMSKKGTEIHVVYAGDLPYQEVDYIDDLENAKKKFR